MPFRNTKTPLKPTGKAKWQIPQRRQQRTGVMEYYLEGELLDKFVRYFPRNSNRRLMTWFGIGFSTLQRFKRELVLQKDMNAVRRQQAADTKKLCEENGYYDSLRGRAPSEAAIEATKKMWAEGFHPMKALKAKNPRKYRRTIERKRQQRLELEESERHRVKWGMDQSTRLHRPLDKFTRRQLRMRNYAKRRGYILGDMREWSGERLIMFYNTATIRGERFERSAGKEGFRFRPLP